MPDSQEERGSRTAQPRPPGVAPEIIEIPAGAFKNTCLQLMDEVGNRTKQYLITKRGRPVAKLVAPDEAVPSAFGFLRGTVVERADIVAPDVEAWGDLA